MLTSLYICLHFPSVQHAREPWMPRHSCTDKTLAVLNSDKGCPHRRALTSTEIVHGCFSSPSCRLKEWTCANAEAPCSPPCCSVLPAGSHYRVGKCQISWPAHKCAWNHEQSLLGLQRVLRHVIMIACGSSAKPAQERVCSGCVNNILRLIA